MSDYTPTTDFSAKDALSSGDSNKLITGSSVDTEFTNIQTAIATKMDKVSSPTANNLCKLNASGEPVEATSIKDDGTDVTIASSKNLKLTTAGSLYIAGTQVTATATEINLLDGVTTLWHSGNDGAGSGLDADTLDGQEGAAYLRSDTSDSQTSGTLTIAGTMDITGSLKGDAVDMYHGGAPTDYGQAGIPHLRNDVPQNPTQFDFSGLTPNTWESVGPTGSSADHIFTQMDDIPTTANFMIVKVTTSASGSVQGTYYNNELYARKTGETDSAGTDTIIARCKGRAESNNGAAVYGLDFAIVPLDSNKRVDLYWSSSGTTLETSMRVVGWL